MSFSVQNFLPVWIRNIQKISVNSEKKKKKNSQHVEDFASHWRHTMYQVLSDLYFLPYKANITSFFIHLQRKYRLRINKWAKQISWKNYYVTQEVLKVKSSDCCCFDNNQLISISGFWLVNRKQLSKVPH